MFIMESNVDCVNLAQQEMSTGEYGRLESLRAVVVPRLDFKLSSLEPAAALLHCGWLFKKHKNKKQKTAHLKPKP